VRIHRVAVATAITAVLGVTAPLAAQAAQGSPQSAHGSSHHAHRAAKPPRSAVLFGLSDHWEPEVEADNRQMSATSGIVGTFLNWGTTKASSIINYAKWANRRKAVPMLDLYPPTTVTLASIAAGGQDSALKADAKALHAWHHAFLFRLFPEMNGPWESYAPGTNGNTSAQFVAAWRHVYRLFRHYGANKVMFVWNPDKVFKGQPVSFRHLWPGSRYVDWVGLDLYNSNDAAHGKFPSARMAAAPSVRAIRRFAKRKPLMVAEIGAANYAGKGRWIKTSMTGLAKLGVKAMVWFNETGAYTNGQPVNWRLDSSSAALRATKQTLAGTSVAWPGHNGGTLVRDERLVLHGHW
jgi:hypothetical protein